MSLLVIKDLRLRMATAKGTVPVLRGVELSVRAGEICGLVGESGAGKTMVGKALLGVLPRAARNLSGQVLFNGSDLLRMPRRKHRALLGRQIALIPQDPMLALNPVSTIGKQFIAALKRHHTGSVAELNKQAASWLEQVAMPNPEQVLDRYPHELSGGMRQRALIAMAFCNQPALIIADEPTTALDVTVQKRVLALIKRMQANSDTAVLFVTHDLGVVAKLCDTVSVMHGGRVIEQGACKDVIQQPKTDYTQALLQATPRFDRPADALKPVAKHIEDALWSQAYALDKSRDH